MPKYFIYVLPQTNAPFWGIIYFLINFTLAVSFFVFEKWIENPKQQVIIQAISESVFFYPLALVIFLVLSVTIYFLSLLLGGKGAFSKTLSTMGLSSFPLVLLFIPVLSPLGIMWWGGWLIHSFQKIHKYKYRFATISVTFPLLILIILMMTIGFINI